MADIIRNTARKMCEIVGWGETPKAYKPEIHGPYLPGRYYGKRKYRLQNTNIYYLESICFDF